MLKIIDTENKSLLSSPSDEGEISQQPHIQSTPRGINL
jgi:hypothetical protein